jgi:hypothetical protein
MMCDDRGAVSLKVTIDRFEDGYAVLLVRGEESVQIDLPAELLPEGCKEGDILDIRIARDVESTEETRKRVSDLIEKLKKKKYD